MGQIQPNMRIWEIINHPDVCACFLFATWSIHPVKDKNVMGWSIDAKLFKPLPEPVETAIKAIMPPRMKKDDSDGRWVLYWKGFYKIGGEDD